MLKCLSQLKQDIKDEIQDDIPVNSCCPFCGGEIEISSLIDNKQYVQQWDDMVDFILEKVADALPEILKEAFKS